MANLATKPPSHDDGLVASLAISTNMQHKSDLSAARSGTIVCPITQGHNSQVIAKLGLPPPKIKTN